MSETETVQHSPLPWRACQKGECSCGHVWAADGETMVLEVQGEASEADVRPTHKLQKANSALIVTAVNDYTASLSREAALVERGAELEKALTGAWEFINTMPVGGHMNTCIRRVLDGGKWTA